MIIYSKFLYVCTINDQCSSILHAAKCNQSIPAEAKNKRNIVSVISFPAVPDTDWHTVNAGISAAYHYLIEK